MSALRSVAPERADVVRVTFGIGSNLGDREGQLSAAVTAIRAAARGTVEISQVVETDPFGGPPQPDYLNAVVRAELADDIDLWRFADGIEQAAGRERLERFGPRTLDVDILDADGRICEDPNLTLPHPRAHLRAFVLLPWAQLDPGATLPGHGSVALLLAGLPAGEVAGVRPRPGIRLA